ncbi:MAG: hypothetical protein UIC65_02800, partial [Alphaproteobacteria bacterium]|nr:hypothetical protein [Alphaproteobacteria bacterium]
MAQTKPIITTKIKQKNTHKGCFFIKSWLRGLDFVWLRLHCTGANQPLVDRHTAVCLLLVVNHLTSLVQIQQHIKIKKSTT